MPFPITDHFDSSTGSPRRNAQPGTTGLPSAFLPPSRTGRGDASFTDDKGFQPKPRTETAPPGLLSALIAEDSFSPLGLPSRNNVAPWDPVGCMQMTKDSASSTAVPTRRGLVASSVSTRTDRGTGAIPLTRNSFRSHVQSNGTSPEGHFAEDPLLWAASGLVQEHCESRTQELRARLVDIDRKLDDLSMQIGSGFDALAIAPSSPQFAQQISKPAESKSLMSLASHQTAASRAHQSHVLRSISPRDAAYGVQPRSHTTGSVELEKLGHLALMFNAEHNGHNSRTLGSMRRGNDDSAGDGGLASPSPQPSTEGEGCDPVAENLPVDGRLKRKNSLVLVDGLNDIVSSVLPFQFMRKSTSGAICIPDALKLEVWAFMEDPDSSRAAYMFSKGWDGFIMATVVITLLQTIRSPIHGVPAAALETTFDVLFLCEAFLRYAVCASTVAFVSSPHNIIDILAAAPPLVLRASIGFDLSEGLARYDVWAEILICIVPILRVLKTLRRFKKFHLFVMMLENILDAVRSLLFMLFVIVLTSSSLIFLVEERENIESLPKAVWFTIVTVTTVGYGSTIPSQPAGRAIACILMICSALYMAMPIGIIGNAFTQIWKDRDRILLMVRTHDRLVQWGYKASDMILLFEHFDENHDGELGLPEFTRMIEAMQIGLEGERIVELFDVFDMDHSGGIDDKEFVKGLWPNAYHQIFGSKRSRSGDLASPMEQTPRGGEDTKPDEDRAVSSARGKRGTPRKSWSNAERLTPRLTNALATDPSPRRPAA